MCVVVRRYPILKEKELEKEQCRHTKITLFSLYKNKNKTWESKESECKLVWWWYTSENNESEKEKSWPWEEWRGQAKKEKFNNFPLSSLFNFDYFQFFYCNIFMLDIYIVGAQKKRYLYWRGSNNIFVLIKIILWRTSDEILCMLRYNCKCNNIL